ncbi:shikimate dehydrogenase [Denitratimonas sp. CY0512]|uniref:shikimate dehydrogenase n=1 Tax=Denitratimonas sp. CY0512 TaxID=3131940 RepID=UPI0030A511E1
MSDLTLPPRFAVFGQPITHSLSPRIHRHFAQGLGIALDYQAIEATPELFPATLARFASQGGIGANVTLPLKEQAATLCLELSPAARRSGAVNTLVRRDDGWFGDNTDGSGLVRDLEAHLGLALAQRQVLLLGAGGAARGVVSALFEAGIAELVVANRSIERARALAHDLAACGPIQVCDWQELDQAGAFDLVLNATSAARQGVVLALPASLLGADACAYDLSYGDSARPFLEWATQHGAGRASDGLGMLVEQAAQAFLIWHGLRPDSAATLTWLREQ